MKTHNKSRTKEYRCWVRIIHRCTNPNYEGYHRYGGRGISVCDHWRWSFENFLADMGVAPTRDHSIDRMKNEQGYNCGHCPDCISRGVEPNCHWETWEGQGNNRRTNVRLKHPTQPHLEFTMAQWAKRLGLTRKCLWKRLAMGWSLERTLTPDGVAPMPAKKAA